MPLRFNIIVINVTLLIIITVTIPVTVNAEENFMINLNTGNLGLGGNFPITDNHGTEIILTLLNIGIEHKKTNVGMEFTPYKSYNWKNSSEEYSEYITAYSLVNLDLYWNVFNLDFVYIGPFTSISYLFVENTINWNKYVFTSGVHVGFRANIGRFNYNIFSVEIGYRNIDGKSKYFIGSKIDIPIFIGSILYLTAAGSSERERNNRHK